MSGGVWEPGPEWVPDGRGHLHRNAARVVLFDDSSRVLLAVGHDVDQPTHRWWFTIGGGLLAGESRRAGAVREVYEETGLRLEPSALAGPVLVRHAEFRFLRRTLRQDEWFYLGRTRATRLDRSGWTPTERATLDGQRWWRPEELAARAGDVEVYPRDLPRRVIAWSRGWRGDCPRISEYDV